MQPEAAQVYRDPDHSFDRTVPQGVCLVVSVVKIIGKETYGTQRGL